MNIIAVYILMNIRIIKLKCTITVVLQLMSTLTISLSCVKNLKLWLITEDLHLSCTWSTISPQIVCNIFQNFLVKLFDIILIIIVLIRTQTSDQWLKQLVFSRQWYSDNTDKVEKRNSTLFVRTTEYNA